MFSGNSSGPDSDLVSMTIIPVGLAVKDGVLCMAYVARIVPVDNPFWVIVDGAKLLTCAMDLLPASFHTKEKAELYIEIVGCGGVAKKICLRDVPEHSILRLGQCLDPSPIPGQQEFVENGLI